MSGVYIRKVAGVAEGKAGGDFCDAHIRVADQVHGMTDFCIDDVPVEAHAVTFLLPRHKEVLFRLVQ